MYSTQDFGVTGMAGRTMTGKDILDFAFDMKDVDSWGMFGALLAWIALFRFAHYALFLYEVFPYLNKASTKSF